MTLKKASTTIQDVASAAGVSVSTVSRVINQRADVALQTRERVLSVIDEMGYTADLAARSMRTRSNNLVGLVVPDIGFPYSIEIMKGINRVISESDYDLLVYTTGDVKKSEAASHEQKYVSLLNNSITDGVIIVASAAERFITNAPIIAVDPHNVDPDYPSVQGTNYKGARQAMEYLIGLGHRRIAFIGGRPEIGSSGSREQAYRKVLKEHGIELDPELLRPGDFTKESGYEQSKLLMQLPEPPTAIFAANDQCAMGVWVTAEELGLHIPDDLSVIGFDNIQEAEFLGLTTVNQNLQEMGYVAATMLFKLINNEPVDTKTYKMPTKLIIRSSCKELRSS
jgi:LacI family transcriptional regulator